VIAVLDGIGVSIKMKAEEIQRLVERVPEIDKVINR